MKILRRISKLISLTKLKKLSGGTISNKTLNKVQTRYELIELIKKYYENYNKDLDLEKILLKSKIRQNKESNNFSKFSVIITILITIVMSIFNTINYSVEKFEENKNNKVIVAALINKIVDYEDKILEIENKMDFTNDAKEKETLQGYKKKLGDDIEIKKKQINGLEGNVVKKVDFTPIVCWFYLVVFAIVVLFLIEGFKNILAEYTKNSLELKIDIINNIQSEQNKASTKILSNKTNEEFLTSYQENIS